RRVRVTEEEISRRITQVQRSNPAHTKVSIKILAHVLRRKLRVCRFVKRAGRDRTTVIVAVKTVSIREDRTLKARIVRHAFGLSPTVVSTGDAAIDLFPRLFADVVD